MLRVVFGVILVFHGYNKISSGLAGTARWFESIGMRRPRLQAAVAAGVEIGAGVAFAIGLLTPLAAAAIIGVMVVAYWVDHRGKGLFIFNGGWEYVLSIIAVAVAVSIAGPGRFSIDHALGVEVDGIGFGLGVAAVGVLSATGQLALSYRPPQP